MPDRPVSGWDGPVDTVLRLARPGEADAVAALAETTGGPLDDGMHAAIEAGTASSALLAALREGNSALLNPAARAASGSGSQPLGELSLALVAVREERVVGALYALPPGSYIAQLVDQGVPLTQAMVTAVAVAKIKALAVEPAYRGRGVASALLAHAVRLYDQLGFHLLYGFFAADSGLGAFYQDRGFEIAPPGQGISMEVILGVPAALGAGPGERLFARWHF